MNKKLKQLKIKVKKLARVAVYLMMIAGILLPATLGRARAIEIEAVNVSNIDNNPDWGRLAQYTDLDSSYQEEIVDKIKAIKSAPDLYIDNQNISETEKNQLADRIANLPEELVFQSVDEIDSQFEANQLVESIGLADDTVLDSLKQAGVIETFLDADGIETIVDPTIVAVGDALSTKFTPHKAIIPKLANQELALEFTGLETGENQTSSEVNYKISYTPQGANRNPAKFEENKVLYQNFWDEVDLVYTANSDSIKEDIILKNKHSRQINEKYSGYRGEENWVFIYNLDLENLRVEKVANQIRFVNQEGAVQAIITSPILIDNQGEISQNAYYELLTPEQYENRYEVDSSRFDLNKKSDIEAGEEAPNENDLSLPSEIEESDLSTPEEPSEDDLTAVVTSLGKNSLWDSAWRTINDWWQSLANILTITDAQESEQTTGSLPDTPNTDNATDEITDNNEEFDLTKTPVEQIGLEETPTVEETGGDNYKYLVLAVNTTNLEYPVDIDPTTYILTGTDLINTVNGQLLSNEINDVKLYDTTAEPTSNYAYNQELKTTLSLNNMIGLTNPDNLVAMYTFDENDQTGVVEDDMTTTPVHGTRNGAPEYADGLINSALEFFGADEYVNMADTASDKFTLTNDFSISVWVNPDDLDSRQPILSKGTAANWEYNLEVTTEGAVEFTATALNGTMLYQVTTGNNVVTPKEWSHVVVERDTTAGNLAIYVNDVLIKEQTVSGNMTNGSADWQIARTAFSSAAYFDGRIDELSIYNDILTRQEISSLYQSNKSKLLGWWNMQEGGTDFSGHVNYGTITGTTVNDNGQVARALVLATGDSFDAGNNYSLSPSDNLTLEAWVKTDSFGQVIAKDNQYRLEICADGRPMMSVYANNQWQNNSGTANACTGSTAVVVNDDSWHHLTGTYDGSYIRLYVDGQPRSYHFFTGSIDPTNSQLMIGQNLTGELDEAAIFNRALSQDEIYTHIYQGYEAVVNNFDQAIGYASNAQLAFDDLYVVRPGVLQIEGTDQDGKNITEKIKLHSGYITRKLSANRYQTVNQINGLNFNGESSGEKLQLSQGKLMVFSPYHDGNWRHGINKVDDRVSGLWHFDEGVGAMAADASNTHNTGWLAGGQSGSWLYAREIDLAPATPVDDYQIMLTLTPENFDYQNALDDGGDLRFYDTNNNELSYWIESWDNGGDSLIWIKVLDSGTSVLTMRYGNSSANNDSDGESVFEFFDDFSGTTIDTSKWVEIDNGNYLSQNEKIISTGGSGAWGSNGLTSVTTFGRSNLELNFRYKPTENNDHVVFGWHDSGTGTSYTDLIYAYYDLSSQTVDVYEDGTDRTPTLAGRWNNGTNYRVKMQLKSAGGNTFEKSVDDSIYFETSYDSSYSSETPLKIGISNHSKAFEIDNLFVRKYDASEPVVTLGGLQLASEQYVAQPTWYNLSWNYRAALYVDNADNPYDLTDYQLPVMIDTTALVPGQMQADFDDVRFTDSDMTTLVDYFYDSANSSTNETKFWVQLPTISAKSIKTFYIYYGNSGAATADSFDNVFIKDFGETNLAGEYHLDDGVSPTADTSGNANNGTLINTPTWAGSDGGQFDGDSSTTFGTGNYLTLNGTNQYVDLGTGSTLRSGGTGLTLSAWIKPTTDDQYMPIMAQRSGGTCVAGNWQFYRMRSTEGYTLYFNFWNTGGTNIESQSAVVIDPSVWTHVAVTYNGSAVRFYKNGQLAQSISQTGSIRTNTFNTYIASDNPACGNYFKGDVDEVRIHNQALSANEIFTQYERRSLVDVLPTVSIANNETDSNLPAWSESGKYGSALSFDGQNDYVLIPDEDSLDNANELTIGAWINPGALDGWIYTKSLTIAPSTGIDNLQLKLTLNQSNFEYLKAKADGSDLRFADANGNKINYWIENYDPLGTSEIWLKIPQAGTNKVYMYYGNANATAETNFDNTFTKIPDQNGLTGLWHMDEGSGGTTADDSANSNTGTLQSGATWITSSDGGQWDGRSDVNFSTGNYLAFDGTANAEVDLGSDSSLQLSTFTFETWVKRSTIATNDMLYAWGLAGPAVYLKSTNTLAIGKVGTWEQVSTGTITDTNWHHIAVTYEAPYIKYYIDGVLDSTDTQSSPGFTFGTSASLGIRADNNTDPLNGYLDEARIYNRILTAGEILANYERRLVSEGNSTISLGSEQIGAPASLYQQIITFDSPTPQADYQAKIELTTTNFDYTKVQEDGGDVRFYDLAGNSLDYYLYDWNYNGTSTIYVKINNQGTAAIYMQYGDGLANSTENGAATISLHDNFSDGQFDQSKWAKIKVDDTAWNEGVDKSGWMKLKAQNGKNMGGDAASAPMIVSQADYMGIDYELSTTVQFESDLSKPSSTYAKTKTGLMVYQDDDNYLFFGPAYNESGAAAAMVVIDETDNNPTVLYENNAIPTVVDLAVVKQQGGYYFFFKDHSSATWTQLTNVVYKSLAAEHAGVASWSDTSPDLPVYFDHISLVKNYYPVNNANLSGEESWGYKRGITLSPATTTDNYQVQVQLDSSFPYANAQTNGEDIRFVDENFNKLSYWIEYWNNATYSNRSSIWVNVVNSGTEKIYMYYGNANVFSESFGLLTFPFFDDFTGTTIDTDRWSEFDNGSYLSQNDKLIATGGSAAWGSNGLTSVDTFERGDEYELRFDYKPTSTSGGVMFGWHDSGTGTSYTDLIYAYYDTNPQTVDVYEDSNNRTPSVAGSWTSGTTYKVSLPLNKTTGAIYQKSSDGGMTWERSYDSTYSTETPLKIGIANNSKPFEIDNLFVKKYAQTESTTSLDSESNWLYKRTVNLSGSTPVNNYQVKLTIGPADIDYNNTNDDGSDIRFFDSNGTLLNYWIERWAENDDSIVWINIPDSGTASFTMYYGNPAATSESNGEATFDMFDDFEDGALDTDKWNWNREVTGTWNEGAAQDGWLWMEALSGSNMWETDNSAPVLVADTNYASSNYEVTVRMQASLAEDDQQGGLIVYQDDANHVQGMRKYWSGQKVNFKEEESGTVTSNDANFTENDFDLKIRKYNNTFRFYYKKHNYADWTEFGSGTEYNLTMATQYPGLSSYANTGSNVDTYYDDFRINKINNINPASDITASLAAEQAKEVDLDETSNVLKKGTAYSMGATDDKFYATLGSQTILADLPLGWSYVTQTYDGDTQKLYINGELKESQAYDSALALNANDVIVGEKFYGLIDDVLVAGKAFSGEEIKTIYESDSSYVKVQPVEEQTEIDNTNIVTDNLVGYWPLSEGTGIVTEDASTNNNTGTLTNGPLWVSGQSDYGLSFDDTNDYVAVGNVSPLGFEYNQPFSISAWIKTSNTSSDDIIAAKMENSGNYRGYSLTALNSATGRLNLVIRNTTSTYISSIGSTKVNDGAWHHVVATYDGSGTYDGTMLYVDGQAETMNLSSDSLGGTTIINTQSFNIGSRASGGVPYKGTIDEVRIYSTAIAASQAGALAHQYDYRFEDNEITSSSSKIAISGNQNSDSDQLAIKIDAGGPTGEATYKVSNRDGAAWGSATYVSSTEPSNLYYEGSDTGVDIAFDYGATFTAGEIYKIASWYTEERSNIRGIRRSFPEVAAIIATDNTTNPDERTIDIIDANDKSLWMRFINTNNEGYLGGSGTNIMTVDMESGQLLAGSNEAGGIGVLAVDFVKDSGRYFNTAGTDNLISENIAYRNLDNDRSSDDRMILNDSVINDIDANRLAGNLIVAVGVTGSNGGVNIVDTNKQKMVVGASGGRDISQVKLADNGYLYLANSTDGTVLAIDDSQNYTTNFNFANFNEQYDDVLTATYQMTGGTINQILAAENKSLADEYSANKMAIATENGVSVIDTMGSRVDSDTILNNKTGFTKEMTARYISESMNGTGLIKGLWIEGDQTAAAMINDISLENNDLSVAGFTSNAIAAGDWGTGVRGGALIFDGDDRLYMSDNSDFDFSDTDNISFGAWVNPTVSQTQTIFEQDNNFALSTVDSAGKVVYQASVNKNSTDYTAVSHEYDLTDAWHYVVGVHDGQNDVMKIFVDGVLEADVTTPADYAINNSTSQIVVGSNSSSSNYFEGKAQGVFVAENKLSDNQIKRLYYVGLGALNDNSDDLNRIGGASSLAQGLGWDEKNNLLYIGTPGGLSEIDLDSDVRTNYWTTTTETALPANNVTKVDAAAGKVIAGTNSGALIINTDGSYTNSSTVGKLQSGKGNDVFTDGSYNYYVSDAGLDVIDIAAGTRKGYVFREGGFNSVTAVGGYVLMGTEDDGIYAANVTTMDGETTVSSPTFHESSTQPLLSNIIYDVHARTIDGVNYLVAGTSDGAVLLASFDTSENWQVYLKNNDGDEVTKVWLNEAGDLAYFNATDGTVNIFDNVINPDLYPYQGSTYSYTRRYSTTTTPAYIGSAVNDLVYVSATSTAESGKDTLYIATNNGVSVIQEHTTLASATVKHYAATGLHDERTGVLLSFDDSYTPVNPDTNEYFDTINKYDPTRAKYNFLTDPDLAGYWDFDQTLPAQMADRSGKNNHGGFGPNTGTAGGKVGNGLYLDGTKSYLMINDDKSLHPTSAFSWSGWVWKDEAISNDATGQPILASKYDSANNGEFVLYFNKNNKLQLKVADGTTNATSGESSVIGTEGWHHVAVTFDSGTVRFYIDGGLDSTFTVAVTNLQMPPYNNQPTAMTDLYLGNDWSVFDNAFGGYLDEVAYYTRALNAEEVQSHYSLTEFDNSVTVNNQDSLAYRTSANLTTISGAEETMYLNFDETLSGNQGESFDLAVESELQRPTLNEISYGGNSNNNIIVSLGSGGSWDSIIVTTPFVLKDGEEYKMWYAGHDGTNMRIGLATSRDGINWQKYNGNNCGGTTGNGCVFDIGSGFDNESMFAPSIIKDGNVYKMWYAASDTISLYNQIGYATSPDGINWTRGNGGNPVLTPGVASSWDDLDVSYPNVLKDGTAYKMWYAGNTTGFGQMLGYATSTDGINWTRYDDSAAAGCVFSESADDGCLIMPLSTEQYLYSPAVLKTNNKYYLKYEAVDFSGAGRTVWSTSQNGLDWNRTNDNGYILTPGVSGAWDENSIANGLMIVDNEKLKYFYSAYDSTSAYRIGLAVMDFEAGRYGKSLRVENNDIYQYDVTNDLNHNQGTVSAWVKLDNTTDALHEVFNLQSESDSNQDGLFLAAKSGQITAGLNGEIKLVATNTLTNNYWNHFVLTWEKPSADNQNLKLYLNGELAQTGTYDAVIGQLYQQLQIGGNKSESRDYLKGNIDELRIYNQALTTDEITELYNGSMGNSAKINTISKVAEGTIEFKYTPDWSSTGDNDGRVMFDAMAGDPSRIDEQYNQSMTAINRLRIWKEEGPTMGDNDRLHFGLLDNDGDLYEVYTNETINWTSGEEHWITAEWDLDNNDLTGGGANKIRILVDNVLVAGDNFTSGLTANKKKNGTDTGIAEEITMSNVGEKFWIGSGAPNSFINLIDNPSYEINNGSDPKDWVKTGSITYDTSGANDKYGTDAVSITGPDTTNKLQQTIKGLIPGTWTLSWWAKGAAADSTQDMDVQISVGALTGTTGNNTDPGTTYKYHNITFTNDTAGDLTLTLSANTAETVWFDGITLVKGQMDENMQNTSSSYADFKISNYVLDQSVLNAEYLADSYDTINQNSSLAGETNNATAVSVKKVNTSPTASDDILFAGTKGNTSEGALTQITFGSPDLRTDEWRQDTSGVSLTSNRINSISYSVIRNNLAVATDDTGVFGIFDDVPASITLIDPNGNEEWEGGSSQSILWNTDFGECDHIDLASSTNGGVNYTDIVTSLSDEGSYTWNPVASYNSNNTIIRVRCMGVMDDVLASDTSDLAMTIDSTSPVFTINNIPNPSGDNIIYGGGFGTDAGGASSISEVQYQVDSGAWQTALITAGAGTTSVEYDFSTTALSAGSHTIYVKGKDSSLPGGNENDLSTVAERTFNVDELAISFDQESFAFDLSVNGNIQLLDSVDVTVTGYGTDYSLAIKADQAPTNRYYPSATIPFYTGNDGWAGNAKGFGWKTADYNAGNYNDFQTSSYEIFKNSFASLLGDTTTVDFKAAIDWTVPAGDYDATVSIVVIPRY